MRVLLMSLLMIPLACGDGKEDLGTCDDGLRITGEFKMADTVLSIDESLGEGLFFSTEHKIDVDLYEAGCISDITMEIKQGGIGCLIDLEFEATGTGTGEFALSSFSFTADSYCPNFPDELEGEYTTTGSIPLSVTGLPSQVEMETGTESQVCLDDIDFRFGSEGTLQLAGTEVEHSFVLNLDLSGDYWSTGSTSADCGASGGDADADLDCGADLTGGFEGPDCITTDLACGDTIQDTNLDGTLSADTDSYLTWTCATFAVENYSGTDRVYRFLHPGGGQTAHIALSSPCDELDLFAVHWADDSCPNGDSFPAVCEGDTSPGGGELSFGSLDDEPPWPFLIYVDGPGMQVANFELSITCE